MGKPKRFWRSGWRVTRALGAGFAALLSVSAAGLSFYESPTVEKLVGSAMTDPLTHDIAVELVAIVAFVNRWWMQTILISSALVLIFWGIRPFWRLRRRVLWSWRRVLGEEVWITNKEAEELLAGSPWGKLRQPGGTLFESLSVGFAGTGMTKYQKDMTRFWRFIRMTLESFEMVNPQFVREVEGNKGISERQIVIFC